MSINIQSKPGNQELIKGINCRHIINAIRSFGPITKKEISQITNLSVQSISTNIERLLEAGIITEEGREDTFVGRKPILFRYNEFYKYIIGIDLGSSDVKIGLGNLNLDLVAMQSYLIRNEDSGESIIEIVIHCVDNILQQRGLSDEDLAVIIIGNPGVVYDDKGRMKMAARIAEKWADLPIKTIFEQNFTVDILVINDINLSAMGEKFCGVGKNYDSFVYLRVDAGIGSGIVLKGNLYSGVHEAAGEFGYITLLPNESSEGVKYKNLESIASIPFIVDKVSSELYKYPNSKLYTLTQGKSERVNFELIAEAINEDDFIKREAELIGEHLGYAAVNAALMLDVELFILGGAVLKLGEYFFASFTSILQKFVPIPPHVVTSPLGEYSGIYGAFAMGADYILEKDMWNL